MDVISGKLKLLRSLSVAETSGEVAELAAGCAAAEIADGAVIYGDSATPGVLHALASSGLPEALLESVPSIADHCGDPLLFDLEAAPGGEAPWGVFREPARAAGLRRGLLIALRRGDEVVGCAVLFWRGTAGDPALAAASSLADFIGPVLGRALAADRVRWERDILTSALPLLSDGVLCVTLDGEQLIYSERLEALVGWSAEEVRARGWTNLVYPDPAYRSEVTRAIAALVMGQPSEGIERTLRCADGRSIRAAIWSRVIPHPSGGPPALVGVMRDVTAQREAARAQRRDESLIQLGRMAGTVAHDLNNLLCSVMGYADLLTLPGYPPEQVVQHAETVLEAAESGGRLTRQLLLLSGTTRSRPAALDPGRAVRQALRLIKPELPAGIRTRLSLEADLPLIEADALQLQQALLNLLTNARDAVGERGEIALSASLSTFPRAPLLAAPDAPSPGSPAVRVQVHDTGPGFTREALAHLLEPFFTTKAGGHGLGLTAVRAAVTGSRGALEARNEGGALLALYLPLSQRPELAQPRLGAKLAGAGRRIWMVEDQEFVLEFSRISLEAQGYEVRVFTRAASALDAARASPGDWPELLILDAHLGADGDALLAVLAAAEPAVPAILITSYAPEDEVSPGRVYVQKPFTGRTLAQLAGRLLAGSGKVPKVRDGA